MEIVESIKSIESVDLVYLGKMVENGSEVQIESIGWNGGWPAGSNKTKANSAQFGLNCGYAGLWAWQYIKIFAAHRKNCVRNSS